MLTGRRVLGVADAPVSRGRSRGAAAPKRKPAAPKRKATTAPLKKTAAKSRPRKTTPGAVKKR